MKLLVLVGGLPENSGELTKIAKKALTVFKKHNITFDGQFVYSPRISITVNQYKGTFEISSTPRIWIIGLNQNFWFGDKLKEFLDELEKATGICSYSTTN